MTVSDALAARRSMRAYLPRPVEREKLEKILSDALKTPSWANSQPWVIYVAEGESLNRIKAGFARCYAGAVKSETDIPRPAEWPDAAKERLKHLHPDMVRDCGDDVNQFGPLNQRLFDAPAVIYLCMDKVLSEWSLYDLGAFSQSLMLSAAENGLGTIPAVMAVNYPDVIREALVIPDNLKLVIGIAVGYVDESNKINNFHSARSPLGEVATFCG